jgi:hypothetical protein
MGSLAIFSLWRPGCLRGGVVCVGKDLMSKVGGVDSKDADLGDDDVFYLFLQKQNLGSKLHIYL